MLTIVTLNCGFDRCNLMSPSGPCEMRPISNIRHAVCSALRHGKFVPNINPTEWGFYGIGYKEGRWLSR
jgi:hypothetical protein